MSQPIQIRISNLNWKATQEDIQNYISGFAKVIEVKLVTSKKEKSKGYAYVTLATEADLQKALEKNQDTFQERNVKIVKAIPLSEKTPREKKEKPKKEKKAQQQKPQQKKEDDKNETKKNDNKKKNKKRKNVRRQRRNYDPYFKIVDENAVHVSNLKFDCTELQLGRQFEQCGEIRMVKIMYDNNDRSKGFGYVEFEQKESVQKALKCNEDEFMTRKLKVQAINRDRKRKNSKKNSKKNSRKNSKQVEKATETKK